MEATDIRELQLGIRVKEVWKRLSTDEQKIRRQDVQCSLILLTD